MGEDIAYPEEIKKAALERLGLHEEAPEQSKELTLNCIMCLHCNDIIVAPVDNSILRWCKCGRASVGGAKDYIRRMGVEGRDYEELSTWTIKTEV